MEVLKETNKIMVQNPGGNNSQNGNGNTPSTQNENSAQ